MISLRHNILPKPPLGSVAVTEPYREGSEDWMLTRTINQLAAAGTQFALVREQAAKERGGFIGIAVYRIQPYVKAEAQPVVAAPAPVEVTAKKGGRK